MKTHEYVSHVCEINKMLVHFPTADQDRRLPNNKMLDLLEFGMPSSWQKAMILQDFDPIDHTMAELVSFCERLELTEPEVEKRSPKNESSSSKESRIPEGPRYQSQRKSPPPQKELWTRHARLLYDEASCRGSPEKVLWRCRTH